MARLITLAHPITPPVANRMVINRGKPNETKSHSYGAYIWSDAYDHVDNALREYVAMCMAHNPLHRPDMMDVERTIEANLARKWTMTDTQARGWCVQFFTEPA